MKTLKSTTPAFTQFSFAMLKNKFAFSIAAQYPQAVVKFGFIDSFLSVQ